MPAKQKYRLEPLLRMKERAKRQAEILLAKAIKALEEEEKKVEKLEEKKKEIQDKMERAHKDMREKIGSGQSRIRESQFHLSYINKMKDDEKAIDKEIEEQQEVVQQAKDKLKRTRRDYMDAAYELNVMEKHRELWSKKVKLALSALENKQMNELGNVVHQMNKMKAG